jgi:hypothetical protein
MDIERDVRRDLIGRLGTDFLCFEEVQIRHAVFRQHIVRADVVAIPMDPTYWGHALAFEVKCVSSRSNYAFWSSAIRQAHDYIYGETISDNEHLKDRRISASFVYPAPEYRPHLPLTDISPDMGEALLVSGAFHAALHMRVGRARASLARGRENLTLCMGPNEMWVQDKGFSSQADSLLIKPRPIGSGRVDVASALGGLGLAVPRPEFE